MTLVELDDEIVHLLEMLRSARRGRGGVVLVTGPVATGKTAVLTALGERAGAAGALLLRAACAPVERGTPYGVADQLLDLPGSAQTAAGPDGRPGEGGRAPGGSCAALLRLAEHRPVVVCVDDAQHADAESLELLARLARRASSAHLLIALAVGEEHIAQPWCAELTRLPHSRTTRVRPLTPEGVAGLVRHRLGGDAGIVGLTTEIHRLSGGNPWLVNALLDDHRAAERLAAGAPEGAPPAGAVIGDSYLQAVLACLRRGEPHTADVARCLALLGESPSSEVGQAVLGLPADVIDRRLAGLHRAGVLEAGGFRHPGVRECVLSEIDPPERARLHLRAARALHNAGRDVTEVALHLAAGGAGGGGPWAGNVLRLAADRALGEGRTGRAVRFLRAAHRLSGDDAEKAVAKALLARAEWHEDPAQALVHLGEVEPAARRGLPVAPALAAARCLLWHGDIGGVYDLLTALERDTAGPGPGPGSGLLRMWLPSLWPALFQAAEPTDLAGPSRTSPEVIAADALRAVLTRGPGDEAAAAAEQVLQRFRQHDASAGSAAAALIALVFADRLPAAARWCTRLLGAGAVAAPRTWSSVFTVIRAEIALRSGDLRAAADQGGAALAGLGEAGWGVAIGAPLATVLHARTAMGDLDAAGELLGARIPGTMFQTPVGLHYLEARGRYYLAADRVEAALADFRACGDLMRGWGMDSPAVVPWRAACAAALLKLRRPEEAMEMVEEQLGLVDPGAAPRVHGSSLRLLAATADAGRGLSLLQESVNVLEACGDRLELARAVADLGHAHRRLGDVGTAKAMTRRAVHLATECGAGPLRRALQPRRRPVRRSGGEGGGSESGLSAAERRVAVLAAQGFTNNEISKRLYITVSTVEQHLTRVYRKLNVRRRVELSASLRAAAKSG
ncbi:LuxR family transcriptional regulator [Actinomadura sp. K4S16]|uniref:helix-turn-helix transcriptional regulator n=1 Tax=Actinomadura sp. K4S16 TaxID=1316147 RepID=UPI00228655C2|nr:LuxR family transcriptional regulator [Actinomadura sp. K4S16]